MSESACLCVRYVQSQPCSDVDTCVMIVRAEQQGSSPSSAVDDEVGSVSAGTKQSGAEQSLTPPWLVFGEEPLFTV